MSLESPPNFWKSPATWLQIVLAILPIMIALGSWCFSIQMSVARHDQMLNQQTAVLAKMEKTLDGYQDLRDDRTSRLATLEADNRAVRSDIADIKTDLRVLLTDRDRK
jgi:septal ring factor EnvC (AmiA/AmiB activator)